MFVHIINIYIINIHIHIIVIIIIMVIVVVNICLLEWLNDIDNNNICYDFNILILNF